MEVYMLQYCIALIFGLLVNFVSNLILLCVMPRPSGSNANGDENTKRSLKRPAAVSLFILITVSATALIVLVTFETFNTTPAADTDNVRYFSHIWLDL